MDHAYGSVDSAASGGSNGLVRMGHWSVLRSFSALVLCEYAIQVSSRVWGASCTSLCAYTSCRSPARSQPETRLRIEAACILPAIVPHTPLDQIGIRRIADMCTAARDQQSPDQRLPIAMEQIMTPSPQRTPSYVIRPESLVVCPCVVFHRPGKGKAS